MEHKDRPVTKQIVIDASGSVLGRLASYAAKQTLLGKKVIIVNCSNLIITGNKYMVIKEYSRARVRGGLSLNGPHFPLSPDRVMKRTVKGMLSHRQGRGLAALKRVHCYSDVPKEFEKADKISIINKKLTNTMTLEELSKRI